MQGIREALNWLIGLELEARHINALQMSARAVIVFILAGVMLRIGNKRFMGKSAALDVMLGIVFGSTVSRAITGNAPFFPTLAAALTLVLLHWVLAAVAFRSRGFARAVKGNERVLVRGGLTISDAMRKAHITEDDLREALRVNGKPPDISRVEVAHLERNGDISVIMKPE
jgi:uncharacterized membrane protein YcaP (DUF421 family)